MTELIAFQLVFDHRKSTSCGSVTSLPLPSILVHPVHDSLQPLPLHLLHLHISKRLLRSARLPNTRRDGGRSALADHVFVSGGEGSGEFFAFPAEGKIQLGG